LVSYTLFGTAIGKLALFWGDAGIVALALPAQTDATTVRHASEMARRNGPDRQPPTEIALSEAPLPIRDAASRLDAHLRGETGPTADLSAIELDERRLTPFRRRVYTEARRIPRGQLVSYAELALRAGSPGAARAVGRAMATNPWPLVVPCHRVVSAEGDLHGFSAPGGTRTKATLLEIEGYVPERQPAEDRPPVDAQGTLPFRSAR
jgi:methylated-DNA-[protein]-cysteine S-methyltransferase